MKHNPLRTLNVLGQSIWLDSDRTGYDQYVASRHVGRLSRSWEAQVRIEQDLDHAHTVFARMPACGVDIDEVTQRLEDEGVEKFIKPFELLLSALRSRKRA